MAKASVYESDCRYGLRSLLQDGSVHLIIQSIPFYGLRDYKVTPTIWGGKKFCRHRFQVTTTHSELRRGLNLKDSPANTRGGAKKVATIESVDVDQGFCKKCKAWLGCLGLEPTVELYVAHVLETMQEAHRLLRDDGVMFLNVGDCYYNYRPGLSPDDARTQTYHLGKAQSGRDAPANAPNRKLKVSDIKEKDLFEVPSLVALALRRAGWSLRARIPWIKLNQLPDSTTDRPVCQPEYFFMLTKSNRTQFWTHPVYGGRRRKPQPDYIFVDRADNNRKQNKEPKDWKIEKLPGGRARWIRVNQWQGHDYYYDQNAVREPLAESSIERAARYQRMFGKYEFHYNPEATNKGEVITNDHAAAGFKTGRTQSMVNDNGRFRRITDWWAESLDMLTLVSLEMWCRERYEKMFAEMRAQLVKDKILKRHQVNAYIEAARESIQTEFSESLNYLAHCDAVAESGGMMQSQDGTPMAVSVAIKGFPGQHFASYPIELILPFIRAGSSNKGCCSKCRAPWARSTTGWLPTCECQDAEVIPCLVVDLFAGTGTTLVAALREHRNSVGCEISSRYVDMSIERLKQESPMFNQIYLNGELQ